MATLIWALLLGTAVLAALSIVLVLVLVRGETTPRFAVIMTGLAVVALGLSTLVDPLEHPQKTALAVTVLGAATLGGWPVSARVLRWTVPAALAASSTLPATGWIGVAERFGFSLALILGLPEVAALIVGVKALGVYAAPAVSTPNVMASARVLGSLTSVGWALLVCATYLVAAR